MLDERLPACCGQTRSIRSAGSPRSACSTTESPYVLAPSPRTPRCAGWPAQTRRDPNASTRRDDPGPSAPVNGWRSGCTRSTTTLTISARARSRPGMEGRRSTPSVRGARRRCARRALGKPRLRGRLRRTLRRRPERRTSTAHSATRCASTDPPVDAFWSLTMYNVPKYYLVANPINRYSIGDRTPGFVCADDGSLDLYIQQT